jgi:predicted enzyme related to lactoylglutathione lyase
MAACTDGTRGDQPKKTRGFKTTRRTEMIDLRKGVTMLVASFLLVASALGRAQEIPREAHGEFTGQVKPVLYVSDVERSAGFYEDVLGFGFDGFAARSDGTAYYAEMIAGTLKFGLHEPTSASHESFVGKQRLYFRVRDLAAHRSRVVARGGEPGEIKKRSWMDMFVVRDHDGNEIVFAFTDPARHSSDPW